MISNNFLRFWNLLLEGLAYNQSLSLSHRIFWIENVRFRLRVKASKLEFHWIENNNGLQLLSILFHHHYVCLIKSVFSLLLITKKKKSPGQLFLLILPPSPPFPSTTFSPPSRFWPIFGRMCFTIARCLSDCPNAIWKTIEVVAQQFSNNVLNM